MNTTVDSSPLLPNKNQENPLPVTEMSKEVSSKVPSLPTKKTEESGRNILTEMVENKKNSSNKVDFIRYKFRFSMFISGILAGIAIAGAVGLLSVAIVPLAIAAGGVAALGIIYLIYHAKSLHSANKEMKDELIKQIITEERMKNNNTDPVTPEDIKKFYNTDNSISIENLKKILFQKDNLPLTNEKIIRFIQITEAKTEVSDDDIKKFKEDDEKMQKLFKFMVDVKIDITNEIILGTTSFILGAAAVPVFWTLGGMIPIMPWSNKGLRINAIKKIKLTKQKLNFNV